MRIAGSARAHGISDADMLHALAHPVRTLDLDDLAMHIGAARNGAMLEIGVADDDGPDPRIDHAMPARRKFWP